MNDINKSYKTILEYIQNRYKDFLIERHIDIISVYRTHIIIGGPTFVDSGSFWFKISKLKQKFLIEYLMWDENKYFSKNEEGTLIYKEIYPSIDKWMKSCGHIPSKKKSNPKKQYRN